MNDVNQEKPAIAVSAEFIPSLPARAAVFLIDRMWIAVLLIAVLAVNEILHPENLETVALAEMTGVLALFVLYFLFRDSLKKQSFGRRLLKQKVINIHTGNTLTPFESFKRNIFFFIPYSPIFEFIRAAGDPQKRRFGDGFAKSVVVKNSFRS